MSACYTNTTWCPKLTGLVIAMVYFVAITFVHDSPYVWMSLTIVVILCLTSFACKNDKPVLRFGANRNLNEPQTEDVETPELPQIWITDIPPSYSFIIENPSIAPSIIINQPQSPGTPPPTYGSAVFKFPGVIPNVKDKETPLVTSPSILRQVLGRNMFRSVSRQVSYENSLDVDGCPRQFSRQNSETSIDDNMSGIIIVARSQRSFQTQTSTTSTPFSTPISTPANSPESTLTRPNGKNTINDSQNI